MMHAVLQPALAGLLMGLSALFAAQAWGQPAWQPEKAVEIVTASAAGGSNDKVARLIQRIVQEGKLIPVPVTVVNRPGGNQTLSRAYLNQHAADAHYFDIGNPTLISNHITGISTQHHTDFTPIAHLISEYTAFTVKSDSPIRNLKDLLEQLRKDPDSIGVGISNRGGTNHLTLGIVAKSAGVEPRRLKVVVFKSNAESITAVIGGHLQMASTSVPTVLGHVQAGRARMIAVATPQRLEGALAEVPTLREHGVTATPSNWRAIIGPKGLTPQQVAFWEAVLAKVVATADWQRVLEANHWSGSFLGSRDFAKFLDAEYDQTRAVMSDLGLAK